MYIQRCAALPSFPIVTALLLSLAVLLAAEAGVTLADAAVLGDRLGGNAVASTLLAPISSVGRKAWDCKPELAALTPRVDEAELPL
ncbi:MAG: hypothetical protein WAK84_06180 [Candidatus Cybelea sp.]